MNEDIIGVENSGELNGFFTLIFGLKQIFNDIYISVLKVPALINYNSRSEVENLLLKDLFYDIICIFNIKNDTITINVKKPNNLSSTNSTYFWLEKISFLFPFNVQNLIGRVSDNRAEVLEATLESLNCLSLIYKNPIRVSDKDIFIEYFVYRNYDFELKLDKIL